MKWSFDNNRHHYRCTTSQEIAIFCDFTAHTLEKFASVNFWIREDERLISRTNSFDNLLMDTHHLMCMDESARIDENMPLDTALFWIFLEGKHQNSVF